MKCPNNMKTKEKKNQIFKKNFWSEKDKSLLTMSHIFHKGKIMQEQSNFKNPMEEKRALNLKTTTTTTKHKKQSIFYNRGTDGGICRCH